MLVTAMAATFATVAKTEKLLPQGAVAVLAVRVLYKLGVGVGNCHGSTGSKEVEKLWLRGSLVAFLQW